jgi:hypothetical protein
MDQLSIILIFGCIAAVVGIGFWYFSKEQRIKRALRNLRPTPIRQIASPGLVKVQGIVQTLDTLTAPLSGRPCAYFEVLVEERISSGKSSHWRTVIREVEERDFLIDDGTGRARIEMVAVQAAITKDGHWSSGTFNDATPQLEEFLARHGQRSEGWLFNRTMRYREGVIEVGEEVAVVGFAELEIDPEPSTSGAGYRDAPMRPVVRGQLEGLYVSDDPTTLG